VIDTTEVATEIAGDAQWAIHLDSNPEDWESRRVYADWLEESGDDDMARCQRWMARTETAPVLGPYYHSVSHRHPDKRDRWRYGQAWRIDETDNPCVRNCTDLSYYLPRPLWEAMEVYSWLTRQEAEWALCRALARLREMLGDG
jgi:uncharacterized protein (TIGR02996 family)